LRREGKQIPAALEGLRAVWRFEQISLNTTIYWAL